MFKRLQSLGLPVLVALALFIAFTLLFLFEFLSYTPPNTSPEVTISAESYREEVAALLTDADPARGETLLTTYTCVACHRGGAENNIAPSFVGVAEQAAERRPPMSAEAYLYESIVHPSAYVVEGYPNSMPQNFRERMTDQELGDVIAYLLTQEAH